MRRALERMRAALGARGSKATASAQPNKSAGTKTTRPLSTVACTITLPNGKRLPSASPRDVAFRMPAEFEPHDGCWVAWPRRADVWREGGAPAKAAFAGVVCAISRFEPVTVIADDEHVSFRFTVAAIRGDKGAPFIVCSIESPHFAAPAARLKTPTTPNETKTKNQPKQYAEARAALPDDVRVVRMAHDDSWLRDTAPTFVHAAVRAPCPQPTPAPVLMATDWRFNGWGDLYGTYERDKLVARGVAKELGVSVVGVDMVLEGGSIHVDGEG